jgi:hypothetical protein
MICDGSGQAGIKRKNYGENNKDYSFYECPVCHTLLPYSPLKDHYGVKPDGNR